MDGTFHHIRQHEKVIDLITVEVRYFDSLRYRSAGIFDRFSKRTVGLLRHKIYSVAAGQGKVVAAVVIQVPANQGVCCKKSVVDFYLFTHPPA